jgi:hypothetical protein
MRFMLMIKSNEETEAGVLPSAELIAAMDKFNEGMMKAGVWVSGDGLKPSSEGARVNFSGGTHVVTDGPFAETKELLAGFWIIRVNSKEEAIDWASRVPGGHGEVDHMGGTFEIEVRPLYDLEDFGPELAKHAPFEASMRSGSDG